MNRSVKTYIGIFVCIVLLDQYTKLIALRHWIYGKTVTPLLSFHVMMNRGISWGLLSAAQKNSALFVTISFAILLLTCGLAVHALRSYRQGKAVYGELLVIAGSCSNLIDRLLRGGVIDFIVVHWKEYIWPVFNIADAAIVCGVVIMLFQHLTRSE